jgi:TatD DNase family protein
VHSRDAKDDTYDILKSELGAAALGVIHCYSYDTEFLGKVLDMGFYVSFTSNVTYKNTDMIKEAVKYTPMDRIMLETDAPYLSPSLSGGNVMNHLSLHISGTL